MANNNQKMYQLFYTLKLYRLLLVVWFVFKLVEQAEPEVCCCSFYAFSLFPSSWLYLKTKKLLLFFDLCLLSTILWNVVNPRINMLVNAFKMLVEERRRINTVTCMQLWQLFSSFRTMDLCSIELWYQCNLYSHTHTCI